MSKRPRDRTDSKCQIAPKPKIQREVLRDSIELFRDVQRSRELHTDSSVVHAATKEHQAVMTRKHDDAMMVDCEATYVCENGARVKARACVYGQDCRARCDKVLLCNASNAPSYNGMVCREYLTPEENKEFLKTGELPRTLHGEKRGCILCERLIAEILACGLGSDTLSANQFPANWFSNVVGAGEYAASDCLPEMPSIVGHVVRYEPGRLVAVYDNNRACHRLVRHNPVEKKKLPGTLGSARLSESSPPNPAL